MLTLLINRASGITASGSIQCRMLSPQYGGNILRFIKPSIVCTLNSSNNLHCHRKRFIVSLALPHSHISVFRILNRIRHSFRQWWPLLILCIEMRDFLWNSISGTKVFHCFDSSTQSNSFLSVFLILCTIPQLLLSVWSSNSSSSLWQESSI
jgi:hypothetical protein